MVHDQRTPSYRQQVAVPAAVAAGAGAWLAVIGRLRGLGTFDLRQVPRAPALHVVQSGCGWVSYAGGAERAVAAGDAFLIMPGEAVRYREDPRRPWRYTWLGWSGPGAEAVLAVAGFAGRLRVRSQAATPALWRLCDEIHAAYAAVSCSPAAPPAYAWRLAEALAPTDAPVVPADPAVALRLLADAGYQADLRVAATAGRLGVDRSTLYRRFRAAYGQGPRSYVRLARLERARALLRAGGTTVGAAAAACGWADHRAFARAFKERYGANPSTLLRAGSGAGA